MKKDQFEMVINIPTEIDENILSEVEKKLFYMLWEIFIKYPATDIERERFVKTLIFAFRMHTKTRRKSGESYFVHDLRCAIRALISGAELNMATIMLCHEFKEDDDWSRRQLIANFGMEIADVVCGGSKPPAIFPTRRERLKVFLKQIRQALNKGLYFWKLYIERLIDRHDNCHDTSGLSLQDQEQLFTETEEELLPLFYEYKDQIPPTLLPFCRLLIFEIEYACANYRQGMINQTKSKSVAP